LFLLAFYFITRDKYGFYITVWPLIHSLYPHSQYKITFVKSLLNVQGNGYIDRLAHQYTRAIAGKDTRKPLPLNHHQRPNAV